MLADENWPQPSVRALRAAGLDVMAVSETMPGATDVEVLRLAAQQGRWVITFDRDYGELVFARAVQAPRAIVFLRQGQFGLDWPGQVILELVERRKWVDGHLVVVSGRTLRRRALPP